MGLKAVKRQWERLGKSDPLWAALTSPEKRGGKWDIEEFFRSGDEEIRFVLQHIADLGIAVKRNRALDFGCGVGRLTQALAVHFDHCDGVDISSSMLEQAERFNRRPDVCRYHLNARDDLSLFQDGAFTFIYSALVLQHIPPINSKNYIREFFRILAPGGAVVFQLPTNPLELENSPDIIGTHCLRKLPTKACRARIISNVGSLQVQAGEVASISVILQNVSEHEWPCLPSNDGRFHVRLGSRWFYDDGALYPGEEGRADLPFNLPPGGEVALVLWFSAPKESGSFFLDLDMLQEGVAWFRENGSATLRVHCRVEGGVSMRRRLRWFKRRRVDSVFAGFRLRHPGLHKALTLTGLTSAYHGPNRVQAWLRSRYRIIMESHYLPAHEAIAIINDCGGCLVEIEKHLVPGGIVSCRYWATR